MVCPASALLDLSRNVRSCRMLRLDSFRARVLAWSLAVLCGGGMVVCSFLFASRTIAANGINRQINYQAKLLDTTGAAVPDGTYSIKFSLYAAASGGTPLWTASGTTATPVAMNVNVQNGLFTVLLGDTALSAGSQNPLNDLINWNSDSLYLGVTVGADAEMTPRKRLASTPYAFNAERLQGMSASGTAFGANALFIVNQTSQTGATGTRSALEIRSSGMSDTNDYLVRGINSSSTVVFEITRLGVVSSSEAFVSTSSTATSTFQGTVSSTRGIFDQYILVNGKYVCLADGTNCQSGGGSDGSWTYVTASGMVRLTTSTNDVVLGNTATSSAAGGAPVYFDLSGGTAGTSNVYFGHATQTNVVIGGTSTTAPLHGLFTMNGDDLLVTGNIGSVSSVYTNGAFVAGSGSTSYGSGLISSGGTTPVLTITSVSGTRMFNGIDNSLGADTRFSKVASSTIVASNTTPKQTLVRDRLLFVLSSGSGQGIQIYDLASSTPALLKEVTIANQGISQLDVQGRYMYVYNYTKLTIFDIANPRNPLQVGEVGSMGTSCSFQVAGGFAYVMCGSYFYIVDVQNPANPFIVSEFFYSSGSGGSGGAIVRGNYAYLTQTNSPILRVMDVSNPYAPTLQYTSTTSASTEPAAIALQGQYLYIVNRATTDGIINVYNVASSTSPVFVTNIVVGTNLSDDYGLVVSGRYLYVAAENGTIYVYDITTPSSASLVQTFATGQQVPNGLSVNGTSLYSVDYGSTKSLNVINLTGIETNGLVAPVAELGRLQVQNDGFIGNRLDVLGSIAIGRGGLYSDGAIAVHASGTTSTIVGRLNVVGGIFQNGVRVCLADGTNCTGGSGSDANWTYVGASGLVRLTTSTNDLVIGSTATSTGAPIYADLSGSTDGTSTVYFGHATNTNVVIGGTSTTHPLNGLFRMNGDDLLVTGNIGSVSSVYTNGGLVVGTDSTYYQDMRITGRSAGVFKIENVQGGGSIASIVLDANTSGLDPIAIFGGQNGYKSFIDYTGDFVVASSTRYEETRIYRPYNSFTITASSGTFINDLRSTGLNIQPRGLATTTASGSGLGEGASSVVINGRYAYVANQASSSVSVVDIANLDRPRVVTTTALSALPRALALSGNTLFVAGDTTGAFFTLDVSDPANPRLLNTVGGGSFYDVAVQNGFAYLADFASNVVRVYDVQDPTNIAAATTISITAPRAVKVAGRFLYITNNSTFYVYDITNPRQPYALGSYVSANTLESIAIDGAYAYVGRSGATTGLVLDISSSTNPTLAGTFSCVLAGCTDVQVHGRYLYAATTGYGTGIYIFDLTDPTSPGALSFASPLTDDYTNDIAISGRYAFVALSSAANQTGTSTLKIFDLGGIETTGLVAHAAEVGSLQVRGDGFVGNHFDVMGSLGVGRGGIASEGALVVMATGTTSTFQGRLNVIGGLFQNGVRVCLADGTNCQVGGGGGGSDSNWTEVAASGFVRLTTSTYDVVMGSTATSTGAPVYFDLSGGIDNVSSTVYFGHGTGTDVVIGGTSTTESGLHPLFTMNGNDLLVMGNIGSVSSVYTNGAFVAGTGSVFYGANGITATTGTNFTLNSVSGTRMVGGMTEEWNNASPAEITAYAEGPASSYLTRIAYRYPYAFVNDTAWQRLYVFHIAGPSSTRLVTSTEWSVYGFSDAADMAVEGNTLVVVGAKAHKFDISDPVNPRYVASSAQNLNANAVKIQGGYAYILDTNGADSKFFVVSLQNTTPTVVGTIGGMNSAAHLTVLDGRVAVLGNPFFVGQPLSIIDVKNPLNPVITMTSSTVETSQAHGMTSKDGYIYTAFYTSTGQNKILVWDTHHPTDVRVVNEITTQSAGMQYPENLTIADRYLYYVNENYDIEIFDISSSTNAYPVRTILGNGNSAAESAVGVFGDLLTFGNTNNRFNVMDIGGIDAIGIRAGSANVGRLQVLGPSVFNGQVSINGGLQVGYGGIFSEGVLSAALLNITTTATVKNLDLQKSFSQVLSTSTYTLLDETTFAADSNLRMDVEGNTVAMNRYVNSDILLYDISEPTQIRQMGTTTISSGAFPVAISQNMVYTGDYNFGQRYAIDIRNPQAPYIAQTVNQSGGPYSMEVVGSFLYVADGDSFDVYSIGASSTLSLVSKYSVGWGQPNSVKVRNGVAYVVERVSNEMYVFDVQNGSSTLVKVLTGLTNPEQITIRDRALFVAGSTVLQAFDITDPYNPIGMSTTTEQLSGVVSVDVAGNTLFVGDQDGIEVFDVTSASATRHITRLSDFSTQRQVRVVGNILVEQTGSRIRLYDIGGISVHGLRADSGEFGRLHVEQDGVFANRVVIHGGLSVGEHGIYSEGPIQSGGLFVNAGGYLSMGSSTFTVSSTAGTVLVSASTTSPTFRVVNEATYIATGTDGGEWGAYINSLLVGPNEYSTGSRDYAMVVRYNSNAGSDGICIAQLSETCPYASSTQVTSLIADAAIVANGFDLAEAYMATGTTVNGDILEFDSMQTTYVRRSSTPYSTRIAGIRSTAPGMVLGLDGVNVALTGRVPTKVSVVNGAIQAGDPLTTSEYPGYAMKATKPGMIVGYALEPASTTSTIEVFVKVGFEARMAIGVNASGTVAQITDDFVVQATSTASAGNPNVSSWGIAFRGSSWNGSQAITKDFTLQTQVLNATNSQFVVKTPSSTAGIAVTESGDLKVGGKLFPSAAGTMQGDKYIFLDTSGGPTTTYMATNADGWQANTSYDFAERYYSPDHLEPGDLVVISRTGRLHVQRSFNGDGMLAGIVSTKPAFIAGAPATSTYPIALAGRVPTKVSTLNGSIKIGDWLAPSTIPGVAVKALKAGAVVGQALEDYDAPSVGKIEVFVKATYWAGPEAPVEEVVASTPSTGFAPQSGLAYMLAGQKSVRVTYASVGNYPLIQVTPYGSVDGGWYITKPSDSGFTLNFHQVQQSDIVIAWTVTPTMNGQLMHVSDGTYGQLNPTTGSLDPSGATETTPEPAPAPVAPVQPVSSPPTEPAVTADPAPSPLPSTSVETEPTVTETPLVSEPVPETGPSTSGSEPAAAEELAPSTSL